MATFDFADAEALVEAAALCWAIARSKPCLDDSAGNARWARLNARAEALVELSIIGRMLSRSGN